MHNPPEGAGAPPLAAAAMPPMPDEHHDTSVGHVDHQMSLSESAGPPPNIVPLSGRPLSVRQQLFARKHTWLCVAHCNLHQAACK